MTKPNNRCARCGRFTFRPAVVIGGQPFGPICAIKAGLVEVKQRKPRLFDSHSHAQRDSSTRDLFEGLAE